MHTLHRPKPLPGEMDQFIKKDESPRNSLKIDSLNFPIAIKNVKFIVQKKKTPQNSS